VLASADEGTTRPAASNSGRNRIADAAGLIIVFLAAQCSGFAGKMKMKMKMRMRMKMRMKMKMKRTMVGTSMG